MEISKLHELFTKERRYLKNVSVNTLDWYKYSFKAFEPYLAAATGPKELRGALKTAVMGFVEQKRKPITINGYIRAHNAFLQLATHRNAFRTARKPFAVLEAENVRRAPSSGSRVPLA
jgi:hypothetical protein